MVDWQAVGREAAQLLARYVQIDTTNPPGNERPAAEFLAQALRQRGFEPRLFESGPGRANLVIRVRGGEERGPVLLLHHMDVVTANADDWSHDPFGGDLCDGCLYGRGALDMKGFGVMQLLALDLLRRSGRPLRRDVILMAVSDEEMEGCCGTGWMVDHHWDEIRPEVVWDEGAMACPALSARGACSSSPSPKSACSGRGWSPRASQGWRRSRAATTPSTSWPGRWSGSGPIRSRRA